MYAISWKKKYEEVSKLQKVTEYRYNFTQKISHFWRNNVRLDSVMLCYATFRYIRFYVS